MSGNMDKWQPFTPTHPYRTAGKPWEACKDKETNSHSKKPATAGQLPTTGHSVVVSNTPPAAQQYTAGRPALSVVASHSSSYCSGSLAFAAHCFRALHLHNARKKAYGKREKAPIRLPNLSTPCWCPKEFQSHHLAIVFGVTRG